jgi:hypothetical protein
LWTQIVGKMRLAQTPWLNHSWHVTLYVSPRGLVWGPDDPALNSMQAWFHPCGDEPKGPSASVGALFGVTSPHV